MTVELTDGLTAIHARLAALAEEHRTTAAVEELRLIRGRLRELGGANADLGGSLGQKQPRAAISARHESPSNGRYGSRPRADTFGAGVMTYRGASNHGPSARLQLTRLEQALLLLAALACLVALTVAAVEIAGFWFS